VPEVEELVEHAFNDSQLQDGEGGHERLLLIPSNSCTVTGEAEEGNPSQVVGSLMLVIGASQEVMGGPFAPAELTIPLVVGTVAPHYNETPYDSIARS